MSLHRRGALSLCGVLLTGGCLGLRGCTNGIFVDAEAFAPVDALDDRLDDSQRDVATEAVGSDGTRLTTYGRAPFRAPTLVSQDDAFYRIERETVETVAVPAFELDAEWEADRSAPEGAAVVQFSALPKNDRRVFRLVLPKKGDRFPTEGFSVGRFPAPYPDGGEDSRLVGETTWVEWEGRDVRVEVAGEQTGTTERVTYEFTATQVADDPTAFRAFLAEQYLVDLSDAPPAQQELLRAARTEDGYEECLPASDALAALRDRLADAPTLPEPYRPEWYVAVDGERVGLSVTEWVA